MPLKHVAKPGDRIQTARHDLGPSSRLQQREYRIVCGVRIAAQQRVRHVAVVDRLAGVLPAEPEEPEQAGHFSAQPGILDVVDPGLDHGDIIRQAMLPDMANDCVETLDERLFLGFRGADF